MINIDDKVLFGFLNDLVQKEELWITPILKEDASGRIRMFVEVNPGPFNYASQQVFKLLHDSILDNKQKEQEEMERENAAAAKAYKERKTIRNSKVYLMVNNQTNNYKIGRSANPEFRERTLQSQEPDVTLLFYCPEEVISERDLHDMFADKRVRGEWFALDSNDVLEIKKLMQA